MDEARNQNGTFAVGNPGGPGRPRRAVEREYLAAMLNEIPLEVWTQIVQKAVESAKYGDVKARDWIARYVIGLNPPMTPSELAADEADCTPEAQIESLRKKRKRTRKHDSFLDGLEM